MNITLPQSCYLLINKYTGFIWQTANKSWAFRTKNGAEAGKRAIHTDVGNFEIEEFVLLNKKNILECEFNLEFSDEFNSSLLPDIINQFKTNFNIIADQNKIKFCNAESHFDSFVYYVKYDDTYYGYKVSTNSKQLAEVEKALYSSYVFRFKTTD